MEHKNILYLRAKTTSDLREKRVIYFAGETAAVSPEMQAKKDRAYGLVSAINDIDHISGGDRPTTLLDSNNPFAGDFFSLMDEFEDEDLDVRQVEWGDGVVTLHYDNNEYKKIEGAAYLALLWEEVKGNLKNFRRDINANINPNAFEIALDQGDTLSKFWFLLFYAAAVDSEASVDNRARQEAYAEIEALFKSGEFDEEIALLAAQRGVEAETGQSRRAATRADVEARADQRRTSADARVDLRAEIINIPAEPTIDADEFVRLSQSTEFNESLDRLLIGVRQEAQKINSALWEHTTVEGVEKIYIDCKRVGIDVDDGYYGSMFAYLRNAADPLINTDLADSRHAQWFRRPEGHFKDLASLGPLGQGFAQAYQKMRYLQGILSSSEQAKVDTLINARDLDADPVADRATAFVKDNVRAFQEAIQKKDWATAGIYVGGIVLLYKAGKQLNLWGGDGESKWGKWLVYGGAAYAAHLYLKNTGIDLLKMAGLRRDEFEVEGTPLEAFYKVLRQNQSLSKEQKDVDASILARVSEVSLVDLEGLMSTRPKDGSRTSLNFIHPHHLTGVLPDSITREWPFEMGIGEDGISNYIGTANTHLTPNQKEYIRVGQELFKIAMGLRIAYETTLMQDHPHYEGVTYDQAIGEGDRSLGKVRHLLWALTPYAPDEMNARFYDSFSREKADGELSGAFSAFERLGYHMTGEGEIAGHYYGKVMGYPVVFVRTKDGDTKKDVYHVYLKQDYKPGPTVSLGRKYIVLPVGEGADSGSGVEALTSNIVARIAYLMRSFEGSGGRSFNATNLEQYYSDGVWSVPVTLPGLSEFDIDAEETTALITVRKDGKGLIMRTAQGGRIDLDEELGKRSPLLLTLLPRITRQPEFATLDIFGRASLLKLEDGTPGDKQFTLMVGRGRGLPLDMEYVGGKFVLIDPTQETALLNSPAFAQQYLESLRDDENFELNKTAKKLHEIIAEACPQGFVGYFFEALAQNTNSSPLDGITFDLLSGDVPENFTQMILDSSTQEVYERLRYYIGQANGLIDVEEARQFVLQDYNSNLQGIISSVTTMNAQLEREGKDWDRDLFSSVVIDQIRSASSVSAAAADSRSQLEYLVYGINYPGIGDRSDFSDVSHNIVGRLMGVYSFYTAHLDNHQFIYKDPTTSADTIYDVDLDFLEYPAEPMPGITDPSKDPKLRGHYILQYMEYVRNSIHSKAKSETSPHRFPAATARDYWDIMPFDEWMATQPDLSPLDPMDALPAYTHVEHGVNSLDNHDTQLDIEFRTELQRAVIFIQGQYPDLFNQHAIDNYFWRPFKNPNGTPVALGDIGIFAHYPMLDPANTGKYVTFPPGHPNAGQPRAWCKIWDITNRIARTARGQRRIQKQLIKEKVNEFVMLLFTLKDTQGNYRFFKTQPSISARLIHRFPFLRHIL